MVTWLVGYHRHPGSGDMLVLFCHVSSEDHVNKSCSIIINYGYEPLKVSQPPVKFGSHRHCDSWDIMVLVCYMISHDHPTKG